MRRTAATRIVSRVVLPSRVLAVGLGVGVGVLVVVICTNRAVQRRPPGSTPRQVHGGPRHGPPDPPTLEERHGCAATLRATPGVLGGPSRSVTAAPRRSEPRGVLGGPFEERHGCAGTLRATPGVLGGALRGASRLRRDAPSPPGGLRGPIGRRHGCARTRRAAPGGKGGL